jgi:superfamily II DNA or RNA helicase
VADSFTTGATWLNYSPALAQKFTFHSNFGEEVQCFKTVEEAHELFIGVPRGAVPMQKDVRDVGIAINFTVNWTPKTKEQDDIVEKAVKLLKEDNQFIVCAPTGYGKTWLGAAIAGRLGRRFCVITTKEDCVFEWKKAIQATLGLTDDEVGIWRADDGPTMKHKAVVCLVQSVMKGPERYGELAYRGFGLVMVDEVQRMGADQFSQAMWHFPSKLRMGLSATPWRRDGKDKVFMWHIGPVMVEATSETMVPKVLVHKTGWSVPRDSFGRPAIPHNFGDIGALLPAMRHSKVRNLLAVNYITSTLEKGRNVIAFSESLNHLDIIAGLLMAAGIKKESIGFYVGVPNPVYEVPLGTKHRKDVEREVRAQHSARPILLATYAMGSEATNLPWLDTCLMLTPRANVNQIVGRIRREYEDKKQPVVIDFVDGGSRVLSQYALARRRWYIKLGCEIKDYQ